MGLECIPTYHKFKLCIPGTKCDGQDMFDTTFFSNCKVCRPSTVEGVIREGGFLRTMEAGGMQISYCSMV